jgi:hypothetical protein
MARQRPFFLRLAVLAVDISPPVPDSDALPANARYQETPG